MRNPESRAEPRTSATAAPISAGQPASTTWVPRTSDSIARQFWLLVAALLVAAGGLRVVGMVDDFWLDEIWSWLFARDKQSIAEIFTAIHHDNNHYLNTIWLHLIGDQPYFWLYRLHSYIAGLLCIAGCGLLAGDVAYDANEALRSRSTTKRTRGAAAPLSFADSGTFARFCALVTMLLLATSYVHIVYSSEARGYSMAAAAGIFSTWLLRRIVRDRSRPKPLAQLGFVALSIFGVLSHLSYVTVLFPHLVWGAFELFRRRPIMWAFCFLPTLFVIAVVWYVDLRFATVGGAPLLSLFSVLLESLALPMGVSDHEALLLACAFVMGFLLLSGLAYLRRASFSDCLLFALMICLAPPLMIIMRSNGMLTTRHFIVVWICLYPVLGIAVGRMAGYGIGKLSLVAVVLTIWVATNGWEYTQFAIHGRGHYERATRWLLAEVKKSKDATGKPQLVGSDHDFRNTIVLSFYLKRLTTEPGFDYKNRGEWPASGVDWLITHQVERGIEPKPTINVDSHQYDLVYMERFHAPIGWSWAIYHRHGL